MVNIYAIILARGGSKGLPRKNLHPLADKPLIAHTIIAALDCPQISRCIVSTEDAEIKQVSIAWGAEVLDRPAELATDTAMSRDVVKSLLLVLREQNCLPDYFVLLQPTSPLRNAKHLSECIQLFFTAQSKCAISVTETEHHPYKSVYISEDGLKPLFEAEALEAPRQTLPKIYRPNGAIYLMPSKLFLENCTFFIPPVFPYIMVSQESIDIDTALDLTIAESILRQ